MPLLQRHTRRPRAPTCAPYTSWISCGPCRKRLLAGESIRVVPDQATGTPAPPPARSGGAARNATIQGIDAVVLRVPRIDVARNDPTQEVVVVRVTTEDGQTGLAECNHSAAPVLAAVQSKGASSIGAGLAPLLIGRHVDEHRALTRELYESNVFSMRRGLGLALLHAIDTCLWDLTAQLQGQPLWRLLWGEAAQRPSPYLTLYTGPGHYQSSVRALARLIERGMPLGYRAAKLEPLVDCVPENRIADFVATGRRLLGPDVELFIDFGHRFADADVSYRHIAAIAEHNVSLIETPMLTDDVWEYARLAEVSPVPLAASELYESVWEYRALLEIADIAVVQPWPNRMGITETLDVAQRAAALDRRCVLAGWNSTPIGVATGVHIAAGLGGGITLEHAPAEAYGFPLRTIAAPEPQVREGVFELPVGPGLGVTLDPDAVAHYGA